MFRKFLFGRVDKVLMQRREEVDTATKTADEATKSAIATKREYEKKIEMADEEKEQILADIKKQGATNDLLNYASRALAVLGYTVSTDGHIADTDDLKSASKLIIKDAAGATVAELPLEIVRTGLAKTGADYTAAAACGVAAVAVLAAAGVAVRKFRKDDED